MSSKFPDQISYQPPTEFEFPPDPMIAGRAAAKTYLHHVNIALARPIDREGLVPDVGMLAMAALNLQTDIDLIAHGKMPEALFANDVYAGGPFRGDDPVIQTTNDLIKIARDIYAYRPAQQPTAQESARGIGLYVLLRNQLHEMLSTMSPLSSDVPWASKRQR